MFSKYNHHLIIYNKQLVDLPVLSDSNNIINTYLPNKKFSINIITDNTKSTLEIDSGSIKLLSDTINILISPKILDDNNNTKNIEFSSIKNLSMNVPITNDSIDLIIRYPNTKFCMYYGSCFMRSTPKIHICDIIFDIGTISYQVANSNEIVLLKN